MNIPKSGWRRSIIDIVVNKIKFIRNEKSFLLLYLASKSELKMMNDGFKTSVGWKEKLNNLIHLFAPFVSGKKKIVEIDNKIEQVKIKNEIAIRFLRDNFENKYIIVSPKTQKIRCFFINKSYLLSIRIETLKTPKIPTIIKKITGKKI